MNSESMLMIIREPQVTEKSTNLADKYKQFAFKVLKTATKPQIKIAVEELFKVKVKSVTVLNVKGKVKRFKQTTGKRKDWKKAFVTLHEGFDIQFKTTE